MHERIGEGGNGQVYRATGPAGTVAVKLIGSAHDLDEAALARFRREITTLDELSHPNLIGLLDHGVDVELGPYLVLPLLTGVTLRELCRGRAVCPEAALLLILPIAEATGALHARGYVHRDLKPENAIATPDGTITVIDLGLAWGDGMSRHTESGAAVGSVGYMSPEQLDGRAVDGRTDIWALGVMLYELIAGKRPFARSRPTEEVAATLLGSYSRLSAADRRTGDALADLVASCLATDPTKRPSLDELVPRLAAMIDWAPAEQLATERASVVADPVGYQQRVAAFRVRRLERLAREAITGGKPFVALAICDRGLAYAPDHPVLVELIASAEAATAQRPPATASEELALARSETIASARGASPPVTAAPSTVARRSGRTAMIAIGATAVAIGVVFVIARQTAKPDPWAASSPATPTVTTTSAIDDRDRTLMRDFVGVFSKALDQNGPASGSAPRPPGGTPTTATGWMALARTQGPADAVTSLRHALRLSPDWPEARAALCLALAATEDAGALEVCTASLRHSPADVGLHAARAAVLIRENRHVEALADLDVVVAADPAPKWRRARAVSRSAVGDAAGAQQDLEHACQLGDAVACQMKP